MSICIVTGKYRINLLIEYTLKDSPDGQADQGFTIQLRHKYPFHALRIVDSFCTVSIISDFLIWRLACWVKFLEMTYWNIFLIFARKQVLPFHANCLQWRQFAWNAKSCFLRKIRKLWSIVVCWISLESVEGYMPSVYLEMLPVTF